MEQICIMTFHPVSAAMILSPAFEYSGANRKKMRDFNKGVAVGYVAGRSQSRYF